MSANPKGIAAQSPRSSFLATLGFVAESRWDSRQRHFFFCQNLICAPHSSMGDSRSGRSWQTRPFGGWLIIAVVNVRQERAADVSSAEPSFFFCRQDAGSTLSSWRASFRFWHALGPWTEEFSRSGSERCFALRGRRPPEATCVGHPTILRHLWRMRFTTSRAGSIFNQSVTAK
jgi:hypothetical protein